MRKFSALLVAPAVMVAAAFAFQTIAVSAASPASITMAGQEHWVSGTGELAGAQVAMLTGNPNKAGSLYIIRLKFPPNTKFPAHIHNGAEYVTVISGTFYVGLGSKFNAAKLTALPAGSFGYVPPKVPHYAMTKGPAVIQVEGIGPFTMTPLEKGGKM